MDKESSSHALGSEVKPLSEMSEWGSKLSTRLHRKLPCTFCKLCRLFYADKAVSKKSYNINQHIAKLHDDYHGMTHNETMGQITTRLLVTNFKSLEQ